MAGRQALVRRLSAVEALGSVTVIATDKTGTLTEESMGVQELASDEPALALRAMVIANDADTDAAAGDPLELGLLAYARTKGLDLAAERAAHARTDPRPRHALGPAAKGGRRGHSPGARRGRARAG